MFLHGKTFKKMMCHRLYSTNIPSHSGIKLSISESLKKLEAEEASNMQSATEATPIGNMKIISNEDTSFSPHRVDLLSGMPQEMKKRSVRIYKPAKSATQSGVEKTTKWRMDFDITNKWQNPLMGWTSSDDPMQGLQLKFNTKDEAVLFAENQGWSVRVDDPNECPPNVKKTYADNFKYSKENPRIILSEKVNNEENDALFVNKQLRVRPPTASRPTTIKEISKSSTGEEVARAEDYDLRNLMESPNVTEFMFLNQLDPNNYAPDLSENDRATEGTPSKSNAPATVRRKLNTKYIENRTKRMICFSKRKMGLLNKAHYIHLFTGCEILVIIASETGNAYTYASPRLKPIITEEKGQSMIRTLLNNPREKIGSRSAKGTASLKEKLSGTQDVNEHVDFTDPNSTRMKKVSEKLLPMVRVSEDNDSVEIDHAISWQQPENLEEKSNYDEAKIVNEPQSIFSEDDTLSCTNFEQKNVDRTKNQAISSPHRFRNRQKLRNRRLKPYLRRQNPSNERLPDNKATNQVMNENVNQVSQEASSSLPPDSHATFRFDEEDLDFSQYLPQPSEVLMVPNEKHKRSKKDIQFNEIHSYHDFPTHLRMPMPQMSFEEYMSRQNQFMMGYTQRYAPPSNFPPRAHPHMPPNFPQGPPPWYNGHPNYGMISGPYTTNVSPAISPLQHSHPINSMKQVNSIVHNSIPQNTAESSRNNRSSQDYLKESNYQRECDGTHGYSRETAGETNSARDNLDYYQTFKSTDDQPPTSSYHNNNLE